MLFLNITINVNGCTNASLSKKMGCDFEGSFDRLDSFESRKVASAPGRGDLDQRLMGKACSFSYSSGASPWAAPVPQQHSQGGALCDEIPPSSLGFQPL